MKALAFFGLLVITGGFLWLGSLLLVNVKTLIEAYSLGSLIGGIVWMGFALTCFMIMNDE